MIQPHWRHHAPLPPLPVRPLCLSPSPLLHQITCSKKGPCRLPSPLVSFLQPPRSTEQPLQCLRCPLALLAARLEEPSHQVEPTPGLIYLCLQHICILPTPHWHADHLALSLPYSGNPPSFFSRIPDSPLHARQLSSLPDATHGAMAGRLCSRPPPVPHTSHLRWLHLLHPSFPSHRPHAARPICSIPSFLPGSLLQPSRCQPCSCQANRPNRL